MNLSCGARIPIASRTANAIKSRTRNGVAMAKAPEPSEATACTSSGTFTRITPLIFCCFEELPADGDNGIGVSHFGNVPAELLAETVDKVVAKMDEGELATAYERDLPGMPADAYSALVEAMFDAFRGRGESSEDAAEGAGTTIEGIERRDDSAVGAFFAYVRTNPGLLKEATSLFVEERPDLVTALPSTLQTALAQRLTNAP